MIARQKKLGLVVVFVASLSHGVSAAEDEWFDAAAFSQVLQGAKAPGPGAGPPGSPEAQRVYNTLFPYYAEICTLTQQNMKHAKPGGSGGHATMFMSGAEIDPSAGYPRLRLAAEGADLSDPDSGTGISVNKVFANVNWIAIPGRSMFFRGGLAPDRTLDNAALEATIQKAAGTGWFAGIEVHEKFLRQKRPEMPLREFIVRKSIGTDFAFNWARHAYCARLPISREAMGKVIANLNGVNEKARKDGYDWNGITDNCSHVPHNALAAAGIWDHKKTRGPGKIDAAKDFLSVGRGLAGGMSDLSVPANAFVRLYEAGNERPIAQARGAFGNHDVVRTMNDGWTSTGPGALVAAYPMHDPKLNEVFDPGKEPFLVSLPLLWDKRKEFEKLTRDPPAELTDLGANLQSYHARYAETLDHRRSVEEESRGIHGGEEREGFRIFYHRFYRHVGEELQRTDARLRDYRRLAGGD